MQSPISIRTLTKEDVRSTALLLAEAFADNPCYGFIHSRVETRSRDLESFFRRNLLWHLKLKLTWVAVSPREPALPTASLEGRSANGESIVGTVTLVPPGGVPSNPLGLVTHWLLPTLFEHGPQTVQRLIATDNEFKRHYLEDTLGLPYWHVHAVAVSDGARRRGVGTQLLRHVMKELEQRLRTTPGPVVLSTQREHNLHFYRQLGFELTGCQQMGTQGGKPGYRSWFLRQTQLVQAPIVNAPSPSTR